MALDMFLKLAGIPGESTDVAHPNEIMIESFSFGEAGTLNSDTGQRPGKVELQDFHFVMLTNAATTPLMLKCADGSHIADGLLTVRKPGGTPFEVLRIKFIDIAVSSFQNAASQADAAPAEQFTFWFGKIEFEYRQQSAGGGLAQSHFFKWDRLANSTS
jgi:type VI secretion system secreted protein Hcp